jgi:tetratricopeptide (TPR) repeat protein
VAEQSAEARIRDLERRLDLDPGSRLFVALAEEYRKLGRHRDALSALQKGLLAHPGYVAAQVALGRVYLEARQTTDAIATFTKVLVADPGNLVASKSLADIYLARGDNLEAVKKYKLYRALSGDRKVDEVIAHLETLVAPRPVVPARPVVPEAPPPPPKFQETDKSRRYPKPASGAASPPPLTEPFEITPLPFEVGEDSEQGIGAEDPFPVPTRDTPLAPPPFAPPPQAATPRPSKPPPPAAQEEPARPTGRALGDLYYAQGHYAEALQVYDDLVARHPFDEDLQRMRRDAEARLLPASASPGSTGDQGIEQRLARIRVLRRWLGAVQAG